MGETSRRVKILMLLTAFGLAAALAWSCLSFLRVNRWVEDGNTAEGARTAAAEIVLQGSAGEDSGEEPFPAEPKDAVVHLIFGGDLLLSDHVINAYDKSGGIQGVLDEGYLAEIRAADLFVANEEFPFSTRGTAESDKQFTFRLPPERVSMFQEMGVGLVTLANNHALDFGSEALLDTCNTLEKAGIRYVGAGADYEQASRLETVEIKGKTIGFLGASRVLPKVEWTANKWNPGMMSAYDRVRLAERVAEARADCDYLVVYVHWGMEKKETPEGYQRELGQALIDAGADLVVGSHPHVLQGIEYYKEKPIVYSLGNFVFGSSIPRTALLKADIGDSGTELSLVFGTSRAGYTRMLADPAEIRAAAEHMTEISFGVHIDEAGAVTPQ